MDEAIALLDTARALDPLSPTVNNLLGRVYVSARRPDDAIRVLSQMLELDPELDLAHQQLGHAEAEWTLAHERGGVRHRAAGGLAPGYAA